MEIFPPLIIMDDIKIPREKQDDDDDRLFIRSIVHEEPVRPIDFEKSSLHPTPAHTPPIPETSPSLPAFKEAKTDVDSNKVTIRFNKFVQLVANHSFIEVVDKNANEEIVISGNLLADLANAHDRVGERRMPLMFVAGIVIGVVLTYIILK